MSNQLLFAAMNDAVPERIDPPYDAVLRSRQPTEDFPYGLLVVFDRNRPAMGFATGDSEVACGIFAYPIDQTAG